MVTCEKCGKEHDGKQGSGRFCSIFCARSYSGSLNKEQARQKIAQTLRKGVLWSCNDCDQKFMIGRDFRLHRNTNHPRTQRDFDSLKRDGSRKGRLLFERGHQCEICFQTDWMDEPIPLELDHIDGHPGHNTKENLRLVCPNCHAQTDTHAGKNVGKHKGTDRQRIFSRYPDYRKRRIENDP